MTSSDKFREADIWRNQPILGLASLSTLAAVASILGKDRPNGPAETPPETNGPVQEPAPAVEDKPVSEELDIGNAVADMMTQQAAMPEVGELATTIKKKNTVPQPAYRSQTGAIVNFRTQALRQIVYGLHKMGHKHVTVDNVLSDRKVSSLVERIIGENTIDVTQQPADVHQADKLQLLDRLLKELLANRRKPQPKPKVKLKPPKRRRR
jgi:hypothetical protein